LGDQPRILHRDHRLRSEVLQQRDLLLGERLHFLPVDIDRPEQGIFLTQCHREPGADTAKIDPLSRGRILALKIRFTDMVNRDEGLASHDRVEGVARSRPYWTLALRRLEEARLTSRRREVEAFAVIGAKEPVRRAAEPHRLINYRIEYWCQVAGR